MNQRMEVRGQLIAPLRLSCPERGEVNAFGLDLSASGISFLSERAYGAGQIFLLALTLPVPGGLEGQEEVELIARTVRCEATGDLIPYRLAAHFVGLDPSLEERLRHFATPHSGSVALHLAHD